jgi:hypothetical protein
MLYSKKPTAAPFGHSRVTASSHVALAKLSRLHIPTQLSLWNLRLDRRVIIFNHSLLGLELLLVLLLLEVHLMLSRRHAGAVCCGGAE